jgi:hypothetical protein
LEIFKTFDLNPISLNQKFAKQFLFFAGSPTRHHYLFPKSAHLPSGPSGPIRFSPSHSA